MRIIGNICHQTPFFPEWMDGNQTLYKDASIHLLTAYPGH